MQKKKQKKMRITRKAEEHPEPLAVPPSRPQHPGSAGELLARIADCLKEAGNE